MPVLFFVNVCFTAANVVLYAAAGHHWWNLCAAVICGFCALFSALLAVQR